MKIEPFAMERWQSTWEHHVELNLSDSGVHPLTLREFLDEATLQSVLDQRLIYTQTNGSPELRRAIAALYPGAAEEHVQVVNGGAEANFIALLSLVEPGDELVMMLPNYMQNAGWSRGLGAQIREWPLEPRLEEGRWVADLERLADLVNDRTKMIVLCNPNNPTGSTLGADELDAICALAAKHGCWVLSDEIYQGSELEGPTTPTVWGRHDRVVVTNSLSKSYGLPGIRLGWAVAPAETCELFWRNHDYTTICPSAISDLVGAKALSSPVRERLLERTRVLLSENLALLTGWLEEHEGLRYVPPTAGAMLYLRYDVDLNSTELADRLRTEKSLLLVPGDHYGMDGWLRIGFGGETEDVREGLRRTAELLAELREG